jgi:hypothetical protein
MSPKLELCDEGRGCRRHPAQCPSCFRSVRLRIGRAITPPPLSPNLLIAVLVLGV